MFAVRTRNLQKIADERLYQLCQFPRYFQVRWTQFNYQLLESVLKNWKAPTKYFQRSQWVFMKFTDKDTLQLTCLLTNLLVLYKRFHQCFEDDNILIFDIGKMKNALVARLDELKKSHQLEAGKKHFTAT